jgi:alkylation response protein AidB-like acyl-CoA dehydrogenase
MFDLTLGEEERLIRETAWRFAETELRERLRVHERERRVAPEVARAFAAAGLEAVELPQPLGGQGLGMLAKVLVLEELAAVDPGAAVALDGLGPALYPLLEGGLADLAKELRGERGVLVEDLEERIVAERGCLSGEVAWVPADEPRAAVVFQGSRGWVVTSGFASHPIAACGLEAAGAARLCFDRAPIAAEIAAPAVGRARARARVWASALLVGAARGAQVYSMRYATERTAFGRPIAHHQALAFLIADLAAAVDAARLSVWRAAVAIDSGQSGEWEAATAFAEAAEQALFVGPNAVQILGGHGFMKDHPVEKWMRDIRTAASLVGGRDAAEVDAADLAPARQVGLS